MVRYLREIRAKGDVADAIGFPTPPVASEDAAKRNADVSFYLFVAGAIAGLFQFFYPFGSGPRIEFGGGFEMVDIARNLAEHGTFANPFPLQNTGPTAVEPPLYPFFLAALTKVLKKPDLVMVAAVIGNISMNALIAAWLPRVSVLFFGQIAPGVIGGLLWLAVARLMPSWDASYTASGLIFFCLLSASGIESKKNLIGTGAAAGAMAGLLILLNASSAMVTMPWVAYLMARRKTNMKKAAGYCCVLLATMFLVVSPWVVRNYRELGTFAPRTQLGIVLYVSNNDCAESSLLEENASCFGMYHPDVGAVEARLFRTMGEVAYDRRRLADSFIWIAANSGRFRHLTVKRFVDFWFPPPGERAYMTYIIWLITALSIPGLILMAWRGEPVTLFIITVLLIYPLIYYVVLSDVRYRYPVLWLSLLPAGYLSAWVTVGITRTRRAR